MAGLAGVPQRSYTLEEIERGLTELALCGGNRRLAAKRLKTAGHPMSADTLQFWKDHTHHERYEEIREVQAPQIAQRIAAEAEDLALELAEAERETLAHLRSQLPNLKPGETAGALRNLSTSKSLNVDKVASPLRQRPGTIIEIRPSKEIVASLEKMGLLVDVDGSAEEISEVQVVDKDVPQLATGPDQTSRP